MTNEEKALEISGICPGCFTEEVRDCRFRSNCASKNSYEDNLEMAEWKDEQFKSVLRELSEWVESKIESAHTRRHTEELENGMSSKFFELGAEDGAFRQVRFWLNNNEFVKNLIK